MPRDLLYQRELLSYINDVKYSFRSNALVLGGTTGSGGGGGTPPGGFVGQLPQNRVTGDTSESTVFTTGSIGSLVDNLNNIRSWGLPSKNFYITQNTPASDTVNVYPGEWFHTDGLAPLEYAGGISPTITAPVGGDRIDLLTINTSGDLSWLAGSVSGAPPLPVFPSATAGVLPLWGVYSRSSGSAITLVDDGINHYVYHDYRPFLGGPTVFPSTGSSYMVYRWQIDGPLSVSSDFDGVYYIPDDYTLTDSVMWLSVPPSSGSVIADIQYSDNSGSTWSSVYDTLPTITSGSYLFHDPLGITLPAGVIVRAGIINPGTGASSISLNLVGTVRAVAGTGTVSGVSVNASDGIIGSVTNPTTVPTINLHLADITPDSVAASGTITGSNLSGTNTGDQIIVLSGDVSGTGTDAITTTLSATGVAPGSYDVATITVDVSGRITFASSGSSTTPLYPYDASDVSDTPSGGASGYASDGGHIHRGVSSVSVEGGDYAYGNIQLQAGPNITLTQTSGSISIAASTGSGGGGGGHVILADGTPVTARPNLNFSTNFSVTDDAGLDATTIDVVVDPDTLASVPEANAGVITDKAVTPAGLPLRVEDDGFGNKNLIFNQPYGGNARGSNAVDFQINRANSDEVASGNNSTIIGGYRNKAIGRSSAILGGEENFAEADSSVILGGSLVHTNSQGQIASGLSGLGQGTIQIVVDADVDHYGESDWVDIYPGGYHVINVPEDTLWTLSVLVSAADESLANCASYQILGSLRNVGGVVEILASTVTVIYEDIAEWNVRLGTYPSPYQDQLSIQVKDDNAASYIRWVATLRISETYFPAGG